MRADPLPRPPQVDNDDDLPNYLSMLFTCILLVSVTKPLFIQETMRSNAYTGASQMMLLHDLEMRPKLW